MALRLACPCYWRVFGTYANFQDNDFLIHIPALLSSLALQGWQGQ